MVHWRNELDIKEIWSKAKKGEATSQEVASEIAQKLKFINTPTNWNLNIFENEARERLIDSFEDHSQDPEATTEDFNALMEELYNWADDGHVCWIKTVL